MSNGINQVFEHEAVASLRMAVWALQADEEGLPEAAASFRAASLECHEHAMRCSEYAEGNLTAVNLITAADYLAELAEAYRRRSGAGEVASYWYSDLARAQDAQANRLLEALAAMASS